MGVALGTILTGCASSQPPPPSGTTNPDKQTVRTDSAPPFFNGRQAPVWPDLPDPSGELSVREAAGLALARNPSMEANRREILRSQALERQAGIWDNPEFEFELEDYRETPDSPDGQATERTLAVSQRLPLGRDAAHRRRLAEARTLGANWDFEGARLELLLQVNRRFILALAADRRVGLAARDLQLARETREVIRQLVDTGKASPVELTRVEVPVVEAELALRREQRSRDAAYRQLALSWNARELTFDIVTGDLDTVPPPPEAQALVALVNSNPGVARWSAAISEQIAARKLARARAIPDPTLRIGIKDRDVPDEEALIVGISFPLPVFDRGQGDLLAAREGESAARARQTAEELRVQALLDEAYTALSNAYDEARALREKALPAAEKGFHATQLAFSEGKLGLLDVLDAQRTLFAMESRHLDALVLCHLNAAEIESLIGQPLEELSGERP